MAFEVDIVLPWVDGEDPSLKASRHRFMHDSKEAMHEDIGGDSRYHSSGEIKYCVTSINLHAPFIRKIFIVTDGQDPDLVPYLEKRFPQGYIPMEIVDHKDIFRGYEEYLPVFNSRAIETMIWRIPGLSEHFILMNDDFILTSDVTVKDFFIDGKTVCYADSGSTAWAKFLRWIKPTCHGHKPVGFKDSMVNALDILGGGKQFFNLGHTPRALKRSFYEDFFSTRQDVVIRNIRHRFRNAEQFNSQELFYISESREGRCKNIPLKGKTLYLKPRHNKNYIDRKIEVFRKSEDVPFCCINSLSLATLEDRGKVLDWLEEKLNQNFRKSL